MRAKQASVDSIDDSSETLRGCPVGAKRKKTIGNARRRILRIFAEYDSIVSLDRVLFHHKIVALIIGYVDPICGSNSGISCTSES
jgi:hypothetical protein